MRVKLMQHLRARISSLFAALVVWWLGWRSVADDPPPLGLQVMGLCDYTGVRSVTAMRDDISLRQWDSWYMNRPTHWMHIPPALPLAPEPPPKEPLVIFKSRRHQGEDVILNKEP